LQITQPIWLETSFSESGKLGRLGEISVASSIINAMQNHSKRSILLFLDEVLYKCLREEQADGQLFNFVYRSIDYLNQTSQNCNNFHLVFLMRLSHYLGFLPTNNYSNNNPFFHYREGIFDCFSTEGLLMDETYSALFAKFIDLDYKSMENIPLNAQTRNKLLGNILLYYATHMPSFSNFKSLEILSEIHSA
jgi:DNA repair protein RecO (recombination protein O)